MLKTADITEPKTTITTARTIAFCCSFVLISPMKGNDSNHVALTRRRVLLSRIQAGYSVFGYTGC